jgi:hypothetical protein
MPVLTGKEEDGKEFYEMLEKIKDKKIADELLECNSPLNIAEALTK